jgi:hypothetical protein
MKLKPARLALLPLAAVLTGAFRPAGAVEELFSRHIQVFQPQGIFSQRLIKLGPGSGDAWTEAGGDAAGFRLKVPADAEVDREPKESRVLRVHLGDASERPRATLRIDRFTPGKDGPVQVDAEYAAAYAEEYPEQAFDGKFSLTDSGFLVLRKKLNLAMVGGTYQQGASRCFRLQCAYLGRDRQLFFTFDCGEREWDRYAEQVGRILLSFSVEGR